MKGLSEARCDTTVYVIQEALRRIGSPIDTLKLDPFPETTIVTALEHFDPHRINITEELDTNTLKGGLS